MKILSKLLAFLLLPVAVFGAASGSTVSTSALLAEIQKLRNEIEMFLSLAP